MACDTRGGLANLRRPVYNRNDMFPAGPGEALSAPPGRNGRPPRQRAKPAALSAQVRGGLHVLYYAAAASAVRLKGSFP